MMRRWPAALLPLLLFGCAGAGAPSSDTARARFVQPDLIEVVASDYEPARKVSLIGPLGELDAVQIDTTRQAGPAYPAGGSSLSLGFGGGGGSTFGGIGFGVPLTGPSAAPAGGFVISRAYVRLPEEPRYASAWQHTLVRVTFGMPPAERTVTIPAPPPPP